MSPFRVDVPKKQPGIVKALGQRFFSSRSTGVGLSLNDVPEDGIVWDVPNPFAPPDPELAHLHALIQAEIAHMRRFESIGPLDCTHMAEDEDEDEDASDEEHDDGSDADDEDEYEDDIHENRSDPILLPRLLPLPLRFLPSPPPTPPPPSPSPSPSPPSSDEDDSTTWTAPTQANNDIANADEHARREKHNTERSRTKILAILGPEASCVL